MTDVRPLAVATATTALLAGLPFLTTGHADGLNGLRRAADRDASRPCPASGQTDGLSRSNMAGTGAATPIDGIDFAEQITFSNAFTFNAAFPTENEDTLPVVIEFFDSRDTNARTVQNRAAHFANGGYFAVWVDCRDWYDLPYNDAINATFELISFLNDESDTWNLNPRFVGAWGSGFAGYFANVLGTFDGQRRATITCIAAVNAPSNLRDLPATTTNTYLTTWFDGNWSTVREQLDEASPITNVDRRDADTLLIHAMGNEAVPFAQTANFAATLEQSGVHTEFVPFSNDTSNPEQTLNETLAAFFDARLRGNATLSFNAPNDTMPNLGAQARRPAPSAPTVDGSNPEPEVPATTDEEDA